MHRLDGLPAAAVAISVLVLAAVGAELFCSCRKLFGRLARFVCRRRGLRQGASSREG